MKDVRILFGILKKDRQGGQLEFGETYIFFVTRIEETSTDAAVIGRLCPSAETESGKEDG